MANHVIRDRIWVSDKLSRCSLPAALAYPWIFLVCDDWGRFEYRPRAIWGQVFGSREDVTVDDVRRWLGEYEREGLLVRYHMDGDLAYWTGFEGRDIKRRRKSRYPHPKPFEGVALETTATVSREIAQDCAKLHPLAETEQSGAETEQETETERSTGAVDQDEIPEAQAYADDVWSAFLAKTGERVTRLMTPGEFETLKGWRDLGIPLRVVLRGIEDTRGRGRMLGYYNSSVLAAYESWRQALGATG